MIEAIIYSAVLVLAFGYGIVHLIKLYWRTDDKTWAVFAVIFALILAEIIYLVYQQTQHEP